MDRGKEQWAALCEDKVVDFIAHRHHTAPRQLIAYFLRQEGMLSEKEKVSLSVPLEENEKEILRGLLDALLRKPSAAERERVVE